MKMKIRNVVTNTSIEANVAGLPDGIALWQGCQIVWLDAQIHAQLFAIDVGPRI